MLIPCRVLTEFYGLDLSPGIVHAGAHWAEEATMYHDAGCERVLWIEGDPIHGHELRARLASFPDHRFVFAILADKSGEPVTFHRSQSDDGTNQGQSSSILELASHSVVHPEVHYVDEFSDFAVTLDEVYARRWYEEGPPAALVALDIQGAELLALQGAHRLLQDVTAVYSEVNVDELYEGAGLLPELDAHLLTYGFELRRITLAGDQRRGGSNWFGWGDGLWIKARVGEVAFSFRERFPDEYADWGSAWAAF